MHVDKSDCGRPPCLYLFCERSENGVISETRLRLVQNGCFFRNGEQSAIQAGPDDPDLVTILQIGLPDDFLVRQGILPLFLHGLFFQCVVLSIRLREVEWLVGR